jgi:hypothetical protein
MFSFLLDVSPARVGLHVALSLLLSPCDSDTLSVVSVFACHGGFMARGRLFCGFLCHSGRACIHCTVAGRLRTPDVVLPVIVYLHQIIEITTVGI